MNYEFPTIRHIDDVLPHIKDYDEFAVTEKDGYTVINYHVSKPETWNNPDTLGGAIRRECRGLIFCNETGKILRRPLVKFFNLNEREETQYNKIDLTKPHIIQIKLDGSKISCWRKNGEILFGTKMGVTEISKQAEEFARNNTDRKYLELCHWCADNNLTPIFEWCSRKQKIVIDYPEDNLVLLAIRHMNTGEYIKYN